MVETTFISFQAGFSPIVLNYTDFAHKISHTKPSKYDSTSGNKISICLKKKIWGMRLWIGTSTFNILLGQNRCWICHLIITRFVMPCLVSIYFIQILCKWKSIIISPTKCLPVNLYSILWSAAPYWNPAAPQDITIEAKESVAITCQADGIPIPNITWLINSKPESELGKWWHYFSPSDKPEMRLDFRYPVPMLHIKSVS